MTPKELVVKFAKQLGLIVNEDALVENEDYDAAYPDNWDEMTEDEKMAWKEEHKMQKQMNEKKPAPAPVSNEKIPALVIPTELMQFNSLIKEIGGVQALRELLLSAATVTANELSKEEQERETLTASIVANSSGFTAEDFENVETPILRKMAGAFTPNFQRVNYAGLGSVAQNAGSKVAPRPSVFLNVKTEKE